MNQSPLRKMKEIYPLLIVTLVLVLASCVPTVMPTSTPPPPSPTPSAPSQPAAQLQHIDLGVGYIPNVQFAPLYVAQAKGFFAEQGLEVALEYGFENDFVALTGQGKRQFAVASGDQVVLARAQGLPIVYVAKWYQRYPVGVMALAETGIDTPKELEGHKVGTPALFGASYVGWKALAYAAGLDEKAIRLEVIGFTQAEAISQKVVDAAVIYVANEPVQLRHAGKKVSVIEVSDYIDMVSNGIVTSETMVREKPELVRKLIRGFLKGLEYTLAHPDEAFAISRQAVPEITDENAPVQRAVLEASLALWRSDTLGASSRQAWLDTVKAMQAAGLIPSPPDVDKLYTNQFVQ
jgi:NitT/TauT family transport system substrate-binding protein